MRHPQSFTAQRVWEGCGEGMMRNRFQGLSFLRARGVVHGNVKNIFMEAKDCTKSTCKLGDFGMAVQVSDDKELMLIAAPRPCARRS